MLTFFGPQARCAATDENQFEKVRVSANASGKRRWYWTFKSRLEFKDCFRRHLAKVAVENHPAEAQKRAKARRITFKQPPNQCNPRPAGPQGAAAYRWDLNLHVHLKSGKQARGYSPNVELTPTRKMRMKPTSGLWTDYAAITARAGTDFGQNRQSHKDQIQTAFHHKQSLVDPTLMTLWNSAHEKLTPVGRKRYQRGAAFTEL